jgi:hypothetical protein
MGKEKEKEMKMKMKMKVESCGGCDGRSSPNCETSHTEEGEEGVQAPAHPCAGLRL